MRVSKRDIGNRKGIATPKPATQVRQGWAKAAQEVQRRGLPSKNLIPVESTAQPSLAARVGSLNIERLLASREGVEVQRWPIQSFITTA